MNKKTLSTILALILLTSLTAFIFLETLKTAKAAPNSNYSSPPAPSSSPSATTLPTGAPAPTATPAPNTNSSPPLPAWVIYLLGAVLVIAVLSIIISIITLLALRRHANENIILLPGSPEKNNSSRFSSHSSALYSVK